MLPHTLTLGGLSAITVGDVAAPLAVVVLHGREMSAADLAPFADALAGLPVLVAHGRDDAELAFAAGEQLRDFAAGGGAEVTWLPFDGGHEMSFVVWRALRKLIRGLVEQPQREQ